MVESKACLKAALDRTQARNPTELMKAICPSDRVALKSWQGAGLSLYGCPSCRGLFVPSATLEAMARALGKTNLVRYGLPGAEGNQPSSRLCPICQTISLRLRKMKGIEIDLCPRCHGVWFDPGELEGLLKGEPGKRANTRKPANPDVGSPAAWATGATTQSQTTLGSIADALLDGLTSLDCLELAADLLGMIVEGLVQLLFELLSGL